MNVVQRGALTAVAEIDGVEERTVRFEAVFAACSKVVFAYARRRATREEAEDVVSETFLVAWRRFDELPSDPLPWLIGAARKVLANRRRSDERRVALGVRLRSLPDTSRSVDPGDTWTTEERVRTALATLPAGEREVIELVAWEELSAAEVATVLEIARATVYVRLHRARQRLARMLEEER
jgi:RNA polymerase sigma-70 factor, ECF subfamily